MNQNGNGKKGNHRIKKVQTEFLNRSRVEEKTVSISLVNDQSFSGTIKSFDEYTILIKTVDGMHLIYKNSICAISSEVE